MRDSMLTAILKRAMEDETFRKALEANPKEALRDHGFAIPDAERDQILNLTTELGSAESRSDLEKIAVKYGLEPRQA